MHEDIRVDSYGIAEFQAVIVFQAQSGDLSIPRGPVGVLNLVQLAGSCLEKGLQLSDYWDASGNPVIDFSRHTIDMHDDSFSFEERGVISCLSNVQPTS